MNDKLHIKIFFDTVYSNTWYVSEDGSGSLNNIWHVSDDGSGSLNNIWYVSDYGSDHNNCHSASTPCRNLQTVLDRATDGAEIYVTSPTLSLDYIKKDGHCIISSSLSYTLRSFYNSTIKVIGSRCMYVYQLILVYFFC